MVGGIAYGFQPRGAPFLIQEARAVADREDVRILGAQGTFSKNFDPLFVLVWVNSKLFQYTYECFFDALRMAGRFLPFTAPYLTIMCIKEADPKVQRRIAGLASKLMDKLTKGGSTDAIERDIDSEFYSLYALSAAETRCPGEISRLFGGR